MNKYILGIDTSCYTTSIALIDINGRLLYDKRRILEVKRGKRGLRQSEAVFQHIKNFPMLYKDVLQKIDTKDIIKICCSSKPRNLEESYMPVFLSGVSMAKTISETLKIDYEEFSHQEGHIEAAKWSSKSLKNDKFIAVHISGGTTEILKVEKYNKRYNCEIIGGTKDISTGQLIDRIGVEMGLNFPAGKELDKISEKGILGKIKLPVSTKGTYINYSGVETFTKRIIQKGIEKNCDIAIGLFYAISKSLYKAIYEASKTYGINEILIAGGVASNRFLRDNLYRDFENKGVAIHFGKRKFCTDNAVGTALLGI